MRGGFSIGDFRFSIFAALALALVARAEEPSASWRVWLEPKFMHAPVTVPIPGAKKTVFAGGVLEVEGLAAMPKAGFTGLKVPWEMFFTQARENAAAEFAELKPRYERDAKKVIVYAALESSKPIVAGAVLAPKFLETFKDTIGDTVLVVVPNRYTAFVFPKLASRYTEYAPMIFRAYRDTSWPVSVEVFEVSAQGWRGVGAYEEP
jgi:hypothetical protein